MSEVFAPFALPLRRQADAMIVDGNGKTVLVIDPDRDLEDHQATAIADYVFAALFMDMKLTPAQQRELQRHPNYPSVPSDQQKAEVLSLPWNGWAIARLLAAKDNWQARAQTAETALTDADDLREALIQADLKIRSMPGTDQSDVEFIRVALKEAAR